MTTIDQQTKKLLRDPKKRQAWIIYQVSLQGRSVAAIGRDHGVPRKTMYRVFHYRYPRIEKIIADALEMRPQELFPERYDADGLPIKKPMGRPKKSVGKTVDKTRSRRNVKNDRESRHAGTA